MALTGHLSDLSLSELIEFFCNQRKTGQLKVLYSQGHGYFYLQTGSVVDARIGVLRGVDAVYYALTLPNANFEFGGVEEPIERTINQPWTQVVLEGLRRLDEGVVPPTAFLPDYATDSNAPEASRSETSVTDLESLRVPEFLSFSGTESTGKRKFLIPGAVAVAIIASVAALGVPAGWYGGGRTAAVVTQSESQPPASTSDASAPAVAEASTEGPAESVAAADPLNDAALAAKRQRDREKAKAREAKAATETQTVPNLSPPAAATVGSDPVKPGPKKVAVTVTYDESGRVTQASGGDASAVRIARQKRFPPGKAGSATVTIPIN